jgi:predicted RNA binding protein YcfA (HicA-like mRNA interferase family)
MAHIRNISLKDCRKFLSKAGLKVIRTAGGHETWCRSDLSRPIVIQTHIDPVPTFIMKQILRALDMDIDDFHNLLNNK